MLVKIMHWWLCSGGSGHFRCLSCTSLLHHLHSFLVQPWHFTQPVSIHFNEIRGLFHFNLLYKSRSNNLGCLWPFNLIQIVPDYFFIVTRCFSEVKDAWLNLELFRVVFSIVGAITSTSSSKCLLSSVQTSGVALKCWQVFLGYVYEVLILHFLFFLLLLFLL